MKRRRHAITLLVALILAVGSVRLMMLDLTQARQLTQLKQRVHSAEHALVESQAVQAVIFSRIPVGAQHLVPINDAAVYGGVALFNLARAHHLQIGNLTIQGAIQGDISITQAIKPVPQTGDHIKRVSYRLKVDFNNLAFLTDFVAGIPALGGYLSDISIKQGGASMTINFLGA